MLKALSYSLVLVALITTLTTVVGSQAYDVIDLEKACSFLENQYDPEIGLLRAAYSPDFGDYYRVYINDNILTARALAVCGYRELADQVLVTLESEYGRYLRTGRHEVLVGIVIDDVPKLRVNEALRNYGNITVLVEKAGNETETNWWRYADWLLLESINSLIKGDEARARELFDQAMSMWDGNGFRDLAFENSDPRKYSVYKLALAVYAYRALGEPPEYEEAVGKILGIISIAQDPANGGIHTDYIIKNGELDYSISDTNVETTSIVILALYSNYPNTLSTSYNDSTTTHLIPLITTATAAALIWGIWYARRKKITT